MRWQLVAALLVLVAIAGWVVFQPRSDAPDLVVARDRLVSSEAVVATFSPGQAEGYRFTSIRDVGWVWERTRGPEGQPLPDAIVYNGSRYLLRIAEGCFIGLGTVKPPLIPGLTVAQKLTSQPGLDDDVGGRYHYQVDGDPFGRAGTSGSTVAVTEDLAPLKRGEPMRATTGEPPGIIWPGDYTLAKATSAERAQAVRLITTAAPSDYGELVIRERPTGSAILTSAILGPYRIVVPEACPGSATLLSLGVEGGQVEALRSAAAPVAFGPGSPAVIQQATETPFTVRVPAEALRLWVETAQLSTAAVTSTNLILAKTTGGGYLGIEVLTCTSRPWFVCQR
jgi:hypothetical protein